MVHTVTLDINSFGVECNENEMLISEEEEMYTKSGDLRKRKKYMLKITSRK